MIRLRSPARTPSPPPAPELRSRRPVTILHPAYEAPYNILLSFPSADVSFREEETTYGVHYRTVHTGSAIIANNRFDGWISRDVSGRQRVILGEGEVLPCGDYWFQVPAPAAAADARR
jgi:hypothetical protein